MNMFKKYLTNEYSRCIVINEHVQHLLIGDTSMRKKDENLRAALLDIAREIANEKGLYAINIRAIAKKAGVASGTVYNYFENKEDILLALTEEYWRKTLLELKSKIQEDSFPAQIQKVYSFLYEQLNESANTLMHSLHNVEALGRDKMSGMVKALGEEIINQISLDKNISSDIWDEKLTKDDFAEFVLMNILALLRMNETNIDPFIEIIKRLLHL